MLILTHTLGESMDRIFKLYVLLALFLVSSIYLMVLFVDTLKEQKRKKENKVLNIKQPIDYSQEKEGLMAFIKDVRYICIIIVIMVIEFIPSAGEFGVLGIVCIIPIITFLIILTRLIIKAYKKVK